MWYLVNFHNVVDIYIKLVVGTVVGTVKCVYAPQVGLRDIEFTAFWCCLNDLFKSVFNNQFLFIGGDFYDHISARV